MTDEGKSNRDRVQWMGGVAADNWPPTALCDFMDEAEYDVYIPLEMLRNLLKRVHEEDLSIDNAELMSAFGDVYDEGVVARIDETNITQFVENARVEVNERLAEVAGRSIDRLLRAAVRSRRMFTASQVYRALTPEMHFRGQIGRIVSALDRAGLIEVAGVARAGFPADSGRPAIVWVASQ
ncbi:hypothetical protein [Rhodococcus sp. IEGM1428]|uniref:hypothetical protein n=1 Tax=Rhodococcus sp. IEGM1428 TaxID=3392191 RepID=UPI003D0AD406